MKRRDFLKTVGAATASVALPRKPAGATGRESRPNVVLMLADDMGYGDVSYLNADSLISTPNIDRIGREGTTGVEEMNEQGHYPSYIYRGYKSDIREGGHRIPFLARWPARIAAGAGSNETVCLTDLLATCAGILEAELPRDAGEDSYDILPALLGEPPSQPIREATVHQAGDGSFSIRQGRWKLALTPSSGGYGNLSAEEVRRRNLPPIQLYDLEADVGETRNIHDRFPEVVERLEALLESYRRRGRSTPL